MDKITKESALSKSANIVEENIEKLKSLFPEVITESEIDGVPQKKIDFEALKEVLGDYVEDKDERYNFTWHGKGNARRLAQTPSAGTLRPCKKESVDWDTTQNLFIEGDNLEVLKLLQKSYHKKVKMIYIDPPYNTGKEFIYPDKYQDNLDTYLRYTGQKTDEGFKVSANTENTGRYHTNWLNMMYPRLKTARNLLRSDGVIFISVDDNEAFNLKKICDDIFGEENFVADIIWQKKFSRANDATYFSTMHDHILCYAKQSKLHYGSAAWNLNLLPRGEKIPAGYTNPDDDPRGIWTSVVLSAKSGTEKLKYTITTPSGRRCTPPDGRYWSTNEVKFSELVDDNRIWFGKSGDGTPRLKTFLSEVQDGLRPNTIWFHQEVGHNQEGRQEVKALFDDMGVFDSPKPVRLLENMLKISSADKDFLVLDFFSGSSTTAHAVMKLNAEDGGKRRFIMVQLPESCDKNATAKNAGYNSIADISKDRIRRAAKKIKKEKANYTDDSGFKVFKLDATNINPWEADFDNLDAVLNNSADSIKSDRTAEDVLYEILLKYGLDLTLPIEEHSVVDKTIYSVGMGALLVCLDDEIPLEVAEGIGKLKEKLKPEVMRVVFKDAGFSDDVVKTNTLQVLKQFGIDDVKSI